MMPSPIAHIWIKLFCLPTFHASQTKPCMEAGTLPKNMSSVTELTMAINETLGSLLSQIQLSNLNYNIQLTPFAAYITLKSQSRKISMESLQDLLLHFYTSNSKFIKNI